MNKRSRQMQRRRTRVRSRIKTQATDRLRLSVHRSGRHIYAQVIDDSKGVTVAAASTLEKAFRAEGQGGADKAAAAVVGKAIAERARKAGVERVVFDRGGYIYHGRIKALAEAAREGGLSF